MEVTEAEEIAARDAEFVAICCTSIENECTERARIKSLL